MFSIPHPPKKKRDFGGVAADGIDGKSGPSGCFFLSSAISVRVCSSVSTPSLKGAGSVVIVGNVTGSPCGGDGCKPTPSSTSMTCTGGTALESVRCLLVSLSFGVSVHTSLPHVVTNASTWQDNVLFGGGQYWIWLGPTSEHTNYDISLEVLEIVKRFKGDRKIMYFF